MITYAELFQFMMVIIAVIALCLEYRRNSHETPYNKASRLLDYGGVSRSPKSGNSLYRSTIHHPQPTVKSGAFGRTPRFGHPSKEGNEGEEMGSSPSHNGRE